MTVVTIIMIKTAENALVIWVLKFNPAAENAGLANACW